MAMEFKYGRMGPSSKVIGVTIKCTEKANLNMPMVTLLKGNGLRIALMDSGFTLETQGQFTKVSGKMISNTERD